MPTSILISIAISVALSALSYGLQALLASPQPTRRNQQSSQVPKPQDGKFSFKQNVPSIPIVLGRAKKAGDYVFLEERNGSAYHVLVLAAHRCSAVVDYYLHDEKVVTFNGSYGVIDPVHFTGDGGVSGGSNVLLKVKLGADAETAWSELTTAFPEIWTADHRGDGLTQLLMICNSVDDEKYLDTYPQQMPQPTVVIEGALVYDPRDGSHDPDDPSTWIFSTNLALLRLHHLTQPWGGKLLLSDMYLPDWSHAANVCDELVTNRDGDQEPRYHGGLWFLADNDPVDIGRKLDEAAELVLYERADGTIGVHAGAFADPDITITADNIVAISLDVNRRKASTVLAVRGRFTDPDAVYNEVDAAIFGDPYVGDDDGQRTATVDNECVQSHNHCQRLQKLRMTRANAQRVSVTVAYDFLGQIKEIAFRRFVRLDYPARGLDEAVVEIIGRPKLSLANLTYTFDGIVVDADLYDFDAATEEGEPGGAIGEIEPDGVPVPAGLVVTISRGIVVGGERPAAYGVAEWTPGPDGLLYELEWQPSDESEPPQMVKSRSGEDSVVTNYLVDDVTYRFRLRAWSNGRPSDWTAYATLTVAADFPVGAAAFDGSNDYLARTGDLTGVSDGKAGTVSCWVKFTGGDGAAQVIFGSNQAAASARFGLQRLASNVMGVVGRNAAGTSILAWNSSSTVTVADGWTHILAAWDLATGTVLIYVDDVAVTAGSGTATNDTLDYTTGDFFVGADSGAAAKLQAEVADLWFTPSFLDLSVTANRRKFINADGDPRFLGSDGSIPTGTAPAVFLTVPYNATDANGFVTNAGTGGGMTLTGALGLAAGPGA